MADRPADTRAAAIPGDPARGDVPILGVLLAIPDFPLLAAGYRVVINAAPDLRVAGVVEHRDGVPEQVARLAADIVVIGWPPSPETDGTSAGEVEEILAARPAARILAIESRCGGQSPPSAIRAGADRFLAREATSTDVLNALRCLGRGERQVGPSIASRTHIADVGPSAPESAVDAFATVRVSAL